MLTTHQKSQSVCNLLCFRNYGQNNEDAISQNNADLVKPQKLSLKKVLENDPATQERGIKNSVSQKLLQKKKQETNRSNTSKKESMLFIKKEKIETEIQQVDEKINHLTHHYEQKISQLKEVKKELQRIQNAGVK